jgi:alpha-D-ribose 1-methylphosphonate 5-triphosphate synthase subunit PhnH
MTPASGWIIRLRSDAAVLEFLNFHTGVPVVREPGANFAFASSAAQLPPLAQFNLGTQEYPDRSTTIVLAVEALTGGER